MEEKVCSFIMKKELIKKGDKVLVAVSGGADSMALLQVLHNISSSMGFAIWVAHLDHGFRGEESWQDAIFVQDYCQERGIPVTIFSYNVSSYCQEERQSTQAGARDFRYKLFRSLAAAIKADKLAIGQHLDDHVETILMRIVRGTGLQGLAGINAITKNPTERADLIRPLLSVTREEIEVYCGQQSIDFRTDKTNFKSVYTRNKIRLEVLPSLKKINPALRESLLNLSQIANEDSRALDLITAQEWERIIKEEMPSKIILRRDMFSELPEAIKSRVLRRSFDALCTGSRKKMIEYKHIRKTKDFFSFFTTGIAYIELPGKIKAMVERNDLVLSNAQLPEEKANTFTPLRLHFPGESLLPELGIKLVAKVLNLQEIPWPIRPGEEACFDYDELIDKDLIIKPRWPGAKFVPFGMEGSKKIKDYFIDQKIPHFKKEKIPLLTHNDEILWVIGMQINDKYKIKPESKRVLYIKIEKYYNP